jgi:hypothetical protein
MIENALHRDVLTARAGLLRHYDSLVSEMGALHDVLDRLRKAAAADPEEKAAIDRLAALVDRQEGLVEQFKSKNALLQNSLAYFGLFSARLATSDRSGPLVAAASTLAAAMLHLTLNTSPATALAVEERLDEFATLRLPPGDAESVRALLAHGRMLHDLLPTTDAVLKSLFAVATDSEQEAIRSLVVARQLAARASARQYRLLLYVTSATSAWGTGPSRTTVESACNGAAAARGIRARDRQNLDAVYQLAALRHYRSRRKRARRIGCLHRCRPRLFRYSRGMRCTSIGGAATEQSFRRAGRSARSISHPMALEAMTEPSIFRT